MTDHPLTPAQRAAEQLREDGSRAERGDITSVPGSVAEGAHTPRYADTATVMAPATKIAGDNAELMERLAHTPTDDEREALGFLIRDIYRERGYYAPDQVVADAILAAGFRRSEVPEPSTDWDRVHDRPADIYTPPEDRITRPSSEPSDEKVEAAAQAMFEPDGPGGEYTWAEMVVDDVPRAEIWREDARKVLRAAGGVR